MGRTLPPFIQLLEDERRAWAPFGRALRRADQATVDHLFDCAKRHVKPGVSRSCPWPCGGIAMAMLLEQHTRLDWIECIEVRWSRERRGSPSTGGG